MLIFLLIDLSDPYVLQQYHIGQDIQVGPGKAGDCVETEVFDGEAVLGENRSKIIDIGPVSIVVGDEKLACNLKLRHWVGTAPSSWLITTGQVQKRVAAVIL
jgi:hypothetical protein